MSSDRLIFVLTALCFTMSIWAVASHIALNKVSSLVVLDCKAKAAPPAIVGHTP